MMIPRRAPGPVRQGWFPTSATPDAVPWRRCCLSVCFVMLIAAIGSARAAEPSSAVAREGEAAPPPSISEPDADPAGPAGGDTPASSDMPAVIEHFVPEMVCDDCCPGCDACCPLVDDCCACFDPEPGCCDLGCDACDAFCGRSDTSFYLGLEFGVLRPEIDRLALPGTAGQGSATPDHRFEFAPRFFGGFQKCNGWGGQVTYWALETGVNETSLPDIYHELDLQTVDVDFTRTYELAGWSIQVGAGGRWGDIESNTFLAASANQQLMIDFEGSGPTALLNVRRPLGCGNWALVGEGRASFLFGDVLVDAPLVFQSTISRERIDIWEGRAGIEWNGRTASGNALFFVRALLEGQFWNMPEIGLADSPDLNFLGPTLSAGFVF